MAKEDLLGNFHSMMVACCIASFCHENLAVALVWEVIENTRLLFVTFRWKLDVSDDKSSYYLVVVSHLCSHFVFALPNVCPCVVGVRGPAQDICLVQSTSLVRSKQGRGF